MTDEAPIAAAPTRRRGRPKVSRATPPDAGTSPLGVPSPASAAPALSEDDPRARAAARAAHLRDHGALDVGSDEFYINPAIIPDGWSYEYKRVTVLNQPDPSYQVLLQMRGWEAVPRTRHPELMPDNWTGNTIEKKGMILMERPMEITESARAMDRAAARELVQSKEQQLSGAPPGQFERDNKGTPLAKIRKSYEKGMAIPEK
jgi:hypothetical protein